MGCLSFKPFCRYPIQVAEETEGTEHHNRCLLYRELKTTLSRHLREMSYKILTWSALWFNYISTYSNPLQSLRHHGRLFEGSVICTHCLVEDRFYHCCFPYKRGRATFASGLHATALESWLLLHCLPVPWSWEERTVLKARKGLARSSHSTLF